ncbi:MAG: glycosyltransferase [Bryobacterales bacterium]|nr:glycosyltransferase [Bryobacterales bacterium]
MRVALFCHSLVSDWNHGNAHFLRGVATDLISRGCDVRVFEPADSWSFHNASLENGIPFVQEFERAYPLLSSTRYEFLDLDAALDGVDLALVHEWNDPVLIRNIAAHRLRNRYRVLFHDTHHRSLSDPETVLLPALEHYDGILAFGDSVSERYRRSGWGSRVWTWHEAADVRVFRPQERNEKRGDLVWAGNWGDDERTRELHEFLLEPVRELKLTAEVFGVRYPADCIRQLDQAGIRYRGWAPNCRIPAIFSAFRATVHIPRRPYVEALRGIPTIRVFEALACGIPLVSAPWSDSENLFRPAQDFLVAHSGAEMKNHLHMLMSDQELCAKLAASGLETILSRHTCAHRVNELLAIYNQLTGTGEELRSDAA